MKKILFSVILISSLFGNFLPGHKYVCETIGVSFRENNTTMNIPNTAKTKESLKKTLGKLYKFSIKFDNKKLYINTSDINDTLLFIKKFKSLDVYVTKDKKAFIFVDSNSTQIGFNIPSQNTMIYYQCQ